MTRLLKPPALRLTTLIPDPAKCALLKATLRWRTDRIAEQVLISASLRPKRFRQLTVAQLGPDASKPRLRACG